MNEMKLRVAKAIFKATLPHSLADWDGLFETGVESREEFLCAAEAAIEAMREPNHQMMEEGKDRLIYGEHERAKLVFQAMIDAALKD